MIAAGARPCSTVPIADRPRRSARFSSFQRRAAIEAHNEEIRRNGFWAEEFRPW
jgi:hypothetical protein